MMKFTILVLTLALVAPAAANDYLPSDAERARWTMFDMNSWRIVLTAYHQDHGRYPDTSTMEELRALVEPRYIAKAPTRDAWGTPYRYERTGDGYRFVSAGADARFDASSWSLTGKSDSFAGDAVLTHEGRSLTRAWKME